MTKLSPTELSKNILKTIDKLEIADGINLMIEDQYIAIKVIHKQKQKIEKIINVMYKHLKKIKSSRKNIINNFQILNQKILENYVHLLNLEK